jgi:hypothetical protein
MVQEINEELKAGVIERVREEECVWVSPTFLVPNKGNAWRKVMDCRELNKFVLERSFQMEDHRTTAWLLEKNQYAVSVDIEKAYHHVPVHQTMLPYLAFQYSGVYFRYIGMPFGIKSPPRVFTHIMRATMTEIRQRWGISSVQYLDDLLFVHRDPLHLQRILGQITKCLTEFGWSINWSKSQLTPTRQFVFLGIL